MIQLWTVLGARGNNGLGRSPRYLHTLVYALVSVQLIFWSIFAHRQPLAQSASVGRTLAPPMATFPKPSMLPSKTPNSSRSIPSSPPYCSRIFIRCILDGTCLGCRFHLNDRIPLHTALPEMETGLRLQLLRVLFDQDYALARTILHGGHADRAVPLDWHKPVPGTTFIHTKLTPVSRAQIQFDR